MAGKNEYSVRGEDHRGHYDYREMDLSDDKTLNQLADLRDSILDSDDVAVLAVDNPSFNIGAYDGDGLVGNIEVAEDGHVNYMVDSRHRRQGIASKLLNKAESAAVDRGINQFIASVSPGSASEGLLQKSGFQLETPAEEDRSSVAIYKKEL